ncbi:MAG: hypothetical protein ACI9J2_000790 [Saprospiraceae bacterium]|jgi:hypothetical protein
MNSKLLAIAKKVKSMHFSLRWVLGLSLIVGGILWFLPILGAWMLPLGLLMLAPDFKWARRGYLSIMLGLRKLRTKARKARN